MSKNAQSTGAALRQTWERLSTKPGGKTLFSILLGRMVPYTGSISPRVVELRAGYAKVRMKDRHRLRQHLKSVHAIALANLAEVTSGLAMNVGLPDDARGIVRALSIEYLKKARGVLTAECQTEIPDTSEKRAHTVHATITDESGDVVARAAVEWMVGPARKPAEQPAPAATA
ncbi:MAG: hotdog fold domain-containing protein [Gemmatimonadaceae bacterium]